MVGITQVLADGSDVAKEQQQEQGCQAAHNGKGR